MIIMALFQQTGIPVDKVLELRQRGLTDNLIIEELKKENVAPDKIQAAIAQADASAAPSQVGTPGEPMAMPAMEQPGQPAGAEANNQEGNIYERIEEITEGMIDEKWDELIAEVKKIVSWKEEFEDKQKKLEGDLSKMKEDFKILHQGVLGKLEDYDTQMKDVGTELKAVGKVFKDVIPEFVENVKELKHINKNAKKDQEQ